MTSKGIFITFEGGEGTGKTTQISLLTNFLTQQGISSVMTREPGGTPQIEMIRDLLMEGEVGRWDPVTEALLMSAARREHLTHVIWPALRAGKWVICDRFADSTLAYQGYGHCLGTNFVHQLNQLVMGSFHPDLTFILHLPPKEGLSRKQKQAVENRFEKMNAAFHERVWQGYQAIAAFNTSRYVIIEADQPIEKIAAHIQQDVKKRFL